MEEKLMKKIFSIKMMDWAIELFPINRSITGDGLRSTIKFIQKKINQNFKKKKIKTNTKVYDWRIPKEWSAKKAVIIDTKGQKICDFKDNNLHLLGYSKKINKVMSFERLKKNIFYLKKQPNSIPYLTSYYKNHWGFSLKYNQFKKLKKDRKYKVVIDTKHFNGNLEYTELLIKGKSKKEILIVSYICHPSMANNELSGPLVVMALSKILKPQKYSVRLLLIPETIGAIAYIRKNYSNLKNNLIAGFNLTCVADKGPFSLISSKEENTYADKIAKRILSKTKKFKIFPFLKRGSNERQFGCQNLNLPFVTICRTRFGDYKEYHTSDDNLKFINEKNLRKSLVQILLIINEIQKNKIYVKQLNCEPFFSKYNLVRSTRVEANKLEKNLFDISAYADKNSDENDLASKLGIKIKDIKKNIEILKKKKILKEFI